MAFIKPKNRQSTPTKLERSTLFLTPELVAGVNEVIERTQYGAQDVLRHLISVGLEITKAQTDLGSKPAPMQLWVYAVASMERDGVDPAAANVATLAHYLGEASTKVAKAKELVG